MSLPPETFRPERMTGGIVAPRARRPLPLQRLEALKLPVIFAVVALLWLLTPGCARAGYWGDVDQKMLAAAMAAPDKVLVIDVSNGGRPREAARIFAAIEAAGIRLAFARRCASACTISLAHKNTCYAPGAVLVFHAARWSDGNLSPALTRELFKLYPPRISAWAKAAEADRSAYVTQKLWGRDLAALDDTNRLCTTELN